MKNVLKRSLSLLLAITIIFSSAYVGLGELDFSGLLRVKANAASESDLTFELNNDGVSYSVVGCYKYAEDEIVIPNSYNGLPITTISYEAFYHCVRLTSVTIGDNVTSIGSSAFTGCTSLKTVKIGNNVISIGSSAFFDCPNLSSITISNSVTTIGQAAFWECSSLTSITIPESVTTIGGGVFDDCTNLTSINVDGNNANYSSVDGVLFNKDKTILIRYPEGKSGNDYAISDNVISISEGAFDSCTNLTSVSIPDGAMSIGVRAFEYCVNLISIVLPDTVTSIGHYAFYDCTSLESIQISGSVMSIGDAAFHGCTSFTSITIPDSVTTIGDSAFADCTNLVSVSIPNSIEYLSGGIFARCENLTTITIPDSVTYIDAGAFQCCSSLETITVPDSVTYIEDGAFRGCTNLTTITIPDGVTYIGDSAFSGCTNLISISLPDNIDRIHFNTFYGCTSLTAISIGDGVTYIEHSAFQNCTQLKAATLGNNVRCIDYEAFYNCTNLTSITIPNSLTYIGDSTFYNCSKLKNVYYEGTTEEWANISIGEDNSYLTNAYIHYSSNKYGLSVQDIADGGVTFSIYNKHAFWESSYADSAYAQIKTAKYEFNGESKQLDKNIFVITYSKLPGEIIVTNEGFQKYIIPLSVTESWKNILSEDFSIYMEKDRNDGKTYISSVFARNTSEKVKEYIDITTEKLNLLTGVNTDVIITAVELDSPVKEYWLSQDENHKISDFDGVFSDVDLYSVFEVDKPVYAYAVLEDGKTTEPISVSLKKQVMSDAAAKFINTCDSSTINFLGGDGFKITLSDDIPLVGGASISTGMASLPVGIEIENERVRISIGVDIFKNEVNGVSDTEWFNFKDSCKSINKAVDEATDKMKTYRNLMIARGFGTVETEPTKKKNFDGSFLGYIEAYIIDGEIVFKEVSGTLALEFFFNYKQQFLVAGIPAIYAYVKAGAEASAEATGGRAIPDENLPIELDINANITPSVKIGGGVGVKDAISAGFWGKGSMPLGYNFTDTHFTLGLKGEIGLEAEFFMLQGDVTLLDDSINLIDHYFRSSGSAKSPNTIMNTDDLYYSGSTVDVFKDGEVSLADRSYLENTSAWLGGQSVSTFGLRRTITPESVTVSDLQTSVYKNSQTQLIQFGDTMLMACIEDCEDRDAYNRMRLVYSVYDIETGLWNEPQAVADNGTSDAAPSLATDGENVYIAWQNIDYTVSTADSETVDLLLKNAEIRLAKYNAETGSFENAITVTDNATYDYAPKVTVKNGVAEVYWINSSSVDFQEGTLSILKSNFSGETETILSGLNYIHSLDSNSTDVSYTMDKDGDTSTTTDVKVYTNGEQVSVDYEGVETSCLYATYAMLDGEKTLFYVDDYNLCYIQEGEEKVVFESPRSINGNLQICSDGNETTAMWLEAGEIGTELYTCSYENGEWTAPVQLTGFSKVLSNVTLTYFDSKVYGVFNRTHLEEVTSEVDGSTYYKNGETDLCQFTTEGFTDIYVSLLEIDESQFLCGEDATFTVLVNNNGTEKVTNISFEITDGNGYSQTIEKTVDLASGASEFIELTYTVPETISQTELSVYANVNEDTDESDNVISIDIGTPDLTIGDLKVKYVEGVYIVSGIVTNKNNVKTENVWLNAYLGDVVDNNLFTSYIGSIEPHGRCKVEFMIDSSALDFSEKSYYDVTLNLSCSNEERITTNNQAVIVVTELSSHIHTYGDWVIEKDATCVEEGSKFQECAECGDKVVETILATGHNYSTNWTIDKKATCTEMGSKSHHCLNCDSRIDVTVISATGHTASSWKTDTEATVYSAGSKHKECTECGEVLETTEIPQLKCSKPKLKTIANTQSGVKITWRKAKGADKYRVYRKTKSGSWKYLGSTSKTGYTDKTAKSGTKYYYAVRARNEAGNSSLSSSLSKLYLADPTLKTPKSTKSGVSLKWTKTTGAQGYIIYRKTGSGSYKKLKTEKGVSNLSYIDKSANKGKKYTYKVKAYYSKTYSAYSNTKTIKDKY